MTKPAKGNTNGMTNEAVSAITPISRNAHPPTGVIIRMLPAHFISAIERFLRARL
jgi:hypothetical protein